MAQIIRPLFDLLSAPTDSAEGNQDRLTIDNTLNSLDIHLKSYSVSAKVVEVCHGPVFTLYKLALAQGVSAKRLSALASDLSRLLCVDYLLVIEHLSGTPYAGIQIRNAIRQRVYLRDTFDVSENSAASALEFSLGVNVQGQPVIADLRDLSHLLIGGMSGAGKSVLLNAIILSILCRSTPEEVRFLIIDPRTLEFFPYEGTPHLLTSIVTDGQQALNALQWSTAEMKYRFRLLSILATDNIIEYNEKVFAAANAGKSIPNPYWANDNNITIHHPELTQLAEIIIVIDDFTDLMNQTGNAVEEEITALVQKAHVVGIHIILSTQHPSSDIISSHIKANITARIALTVAGKTESRTILDQNGAESLLGAGDMLFTCPGLIQPLRLQGAFVDDYDISTVVMYWKERQLPKYIHGLTDGDSDIINVDSSERDPLFNEAVSYVVEKRIASASTIQRFFNIGYHRAMSIIEQLELAGIISSQNHHGKREVLAQQVHKPDDTKKSTHDTYHGLINDLYDKEQHETDRSLSYRKSGVLSKIADLFWRK